VRKVAINMYIYITFIIYIYIYSIYISMYVYYSICIDLFSSSDLFATRIRSLGAPRVLNLFQGHVQAVRDALTEGIGADTCKERFPRRFDGKKTWQNVGKSPSEWEKMKEHHV